MDALEAIGDPGLREALVLVRGARRAMSIGEVAAAQGLHRNVARRRLEQLAAAGLLVAEFERRTGRSGPGAGRPAKVYSPAPETGGVEFPERRYPELVGLLLDDVPTQRREDLGVRFGTMLAAAAGVEPGAERRTALEALCDAMGRLGFQTRLESVGHDRAELVTPTCPLRPLVVSKAQAGDVDRGVWRGLDAFECRRDEPDDVSCEAHDCLEPCASCRVVVSLGTRTETTP
jgi:predicted ArsR family transcriptional regulator